MDSAQTLYDVPHRLSDTIFIAELAPAVKIGSIAELVKAVSRGGGEVRPGVSKTLPQHEDCKNCLAQENL